MDLATFLAMFMARLAGGYAICLGLIGPRVTEGSWRRISLFVIAACAAIAGVSGAPWTAAAPLAIGALLVERSLTFNVPIARSVVWLLPLGAWLLWANERGLGLGITGAIGTVASALAIGGTLGAMLLGHSYLTARGLSFAPLKRIAVLLFAVLLVRAATLIPLFFVDLAMGDLIYLSARVAFGLLMALIFSWMVVQCVKIESNQSATGILYAMTLLVFLGELVAVFLLLERGIAA